MLLLPLGIKQIPECHGQAGFADAGFAGEQDDTPFAASCLCPAPKQEFGFLLAIDERRLSGAQRLETALEAVLAQHSPSALRFGEAFEAFEPKVLQRKDRPDLPPGAVSYYDRVRLGQSKQPGDADEGQLLSSIRSFRTLSDPARLDVVPDHVRVAAAPTTGTFSSIVQRLQNHLCKRKGEFNNN